MSEKTLSRRRFLKWTALAAGGATAVAFGLPWLLGERPVFDRNDSLWAAEPLSPALSLQEDLQVDVAVIGGGYTGLSAAYHLAQVAPEARIVVLEAQQIGHGASGRNGGMVLPQTGPETMQIAEDPATHQQTYRLTVDNMRALADLVAATDVDCELRLDGYLHTIVYAEDLPYYRDYVAQAAALGLPLRLLNRQETAERLGTGAYVGAVYDPNGGQVHPLKLAYALRQAAEQVGVRVYERSPVLELAEGQPVRLVVGEGADQRQVTAQAVVLATNGYTSKLGLFANRIIPVHSQCAATPPLTARQLAAIGWGSRLPFYDSKYLLFHLMLTDDNRIVIGGGNAEYFLNNSTHYRGDLDRAAGILGQELARLYPPLADLPFEYVWNGILGVSYDEYESVGVTGREQNIYYGLAYNGHGVNLAFLFGRIIADLYRRTADRWADLTCLEYPLPPFPPDPLKWLGVRGFVSYYRWQDG